MARHLTRAELEAGLPELLRAPADDGRVEMLVVRPEKGERLTPGSIEISAARGVHGDHWERGCHLSLPDGRPHPDVQLCLMMSRCIDLIAGGRERWAMAGDNLFVDMDLGPENLPPGTRLSVGTAVIEVTAEPHVGCAKFTERFGREACVFVSAGRGRTLNLRGINARVVTDGRVSVGDRLRKLGAA